jgi:hypothetical protein
MTILRLTARILVVAICLFSAFIARADDQLLLIKTLSKERTKYETGMELLRKDVKNAIEVRLAELDKPGKRDEAQIRGLGDQLTAFEIEGNWPEVPKAAEFKQRAARLAKGMMDAYVAASAACTKGGKTSLRETIEGELDRFKIQSDLCKWRDFSNDKLKPWAEIRAAVTQIQPELPKEYRIEIVGTRREGTGALALDFPDAQGKKVHRIIVPEEDGSVRAILTVQESGISADLGVDREGAEPSSSEIGEKALSLRATEGVFAVSSVRIKPVISGAPEQTAEPARKKTVSKPGGPAPTGSGITSGSSGAGKLFVDGHEDDVKCTITELSNGQGTMIVRIGKSSQTWRFSLAGTNFTVTSVDPARGTVMNLNVSGSAINGNVELSGKWTHRHLSKTENNTVELKARF